jgi:hypothetical protein
MSATATATLERPLTATARDALRRAGNPFRNYFARNPDDEVCGRYHVPELFAAERDLLHAIIDLYRYDPSTHSEVVPVLGNKGAGKTHLLHSIKHGVGGQWQLLVTPGVYQKDTDFLEYLLFQIIDTLLGGGKQKGARPLDYVGDRLVRRRLAAALRAMEPDDKVELFPPPGIGRWARRLGIGHAQAAERAEWLADTLSGDGGFGRPPAPLPQTLADAGLTPERAFDLLAAHAERTEPHNTAGLMRRAVAAGFARAALLKDEADLANFLTYGFAELDFKVQPTRQDLVLALFKVLMDVLRGLKIPVVVAFDQLEDLLLARRTDDAHRIAEAFFAGIVQIMHQIDGVCVLVFAERGLWNRFVPSLDGYIQDRLNNPVHVPGHGTVKALRLEAPAAPLVRRVVEARLRPVLDELPEADALPDTFPFADEHIARVAATEPTLRDMLQQFRHLFDHVVYGEPAAARPAAVENIAKVAATVEEPTFTPAAPASRIDALLGKDADVPPPAPAMTFKSVAIVSDGSSSVARAPSQPPAAPQPLPAPAEPRATDAKPLSPAALAELWDQEFRSARRRLEPDGALTGATRELQAGLGALLTFCHEQGVKVGPWRLQHVVPEWTFGEHPTYGAVSLAHWACKDAPPWKVGVGLFLARGGGKPKDLEVKLAAFGVQPATVDVLVLLRPEDDLGLSGKSKTLWAEAERKGHHARLEAVSLDAFAVLGSFPRWLAAVREALPEGTPLPPLADLVQDRCERLLEQVCMPVQG